MDVSLLLPFFDTLSPPLIPYIIILANFILFNLLRRLINKLILRYYLIHEKSNSKKQQQQQRSSIGNQYEGKIRIVKLFLDELISTCELCADCAELNVVYERHGSLAYGAVLFLLTYLWMDTFGDAHTSPAYLVEDYFLVKGNELLKTGDAYARFVGQSIAMPLAWRLASFYWRYQLLSEHREMLITENCKSSLSTSTLNGFLIEFGCCLICRLLELLGHKLLERQQFSKRVISMSSAFICTLLVVLSLELSGGYFNPILAASLEYGCKGINFQQHALVFWLGPLLGHLLARRMFRCAVDETSSSVVSQVRPKRQQQHNSSGSGKHSRNNSAAESTASNQRRLTRSISSSNKRKQSPGSG